MTELFEIRVVKITRPVVGTQTHDTVYLAKPATMPDPGPIIASFNPTLILPLFNPRLMLPLPSPSA
jgi:hypothetical protein